MLENAVATLLTKIFTPELFPGLDFFHAGTAELKVVLGTGTAIVALLTLVSSLTRKVIARRKAKKAAKCQEMICSSQITEAAFDAYLKMIDVACKNMPRREGT